MRILVTGATGFVGRPLCDHLLAQGHTVRAALRRRAELDPRLEALEVGEIGPDTDWRTALHGVDTVVHLAARVHVMNETATDPLEAFRQVNAHGTAKLAQAATQMGVGRMVFVSTIKVNGEATDAYPFTEADQPDLQSPYAVSKWEGEQALREAADGTPMEFVIVRPPLVYGPGVKGNFARLIGLARRGLPLPLASVDNRRSLIGVRNLVDFLAACATHPAATNRTFLVSDGEDLSTPDLIRRLAGVLGAPARLFAFPTGLLHFGARVVGRGALTDRLLGSLQVDSSAAGQVLGWEPPYTVDEELARVAAWAKSEGA